MNLIINLKNIYSMNWEKSFHVIVYFALLASSMPRNNTFIINLLTFIIVKICTLFQFQWQSAFWVSIIKIILFIFFVCNMSSYKNLNFPVARKRCINTVQTLCNITHKPVLFCLLLISSPCVCKKPQKTKNSKK